MSYTQNKASMKQIEDKPKEQIKEPTLPVFIPMRIVRWVLYSIGFTGPLAMWYPDLVGWDGLIGTCLILGHFASQLNALINKKA